MIDVIKLNIKSFSRKKTFKNYLVINVFLFLFFLSTLVIRAFCVGQIDSVVNDEGNRIINVNYYSKNEDFINFIEVNSTEIDKVYYYVDIYDYEIDNKYYYITTGEMISEDDCIKVNPKLKKDKIKIFNLTVDNLIYDDNLDENIIIINQNVAKYLFYNNYVKNCFISFKIKNYYNINDIFSSLNDYNIDANLNTDSSDSLSVYRNINTILGVLFIFLIIISIFITFFLMLTFLHEQKNNIKIYNDIGFNAMNIIIIYVLDFMFYIMLSYLLSISIVFFSLIFFYLVGYNFLQYFWKIFLIPMLFIVILNICITSSCILFMLKKSE